MGLFSRKPIAVIVSYRELTHSADLDGHGYAFSWPLRESPTPGTRVVVPGMDGQAFGVVLRAATAKDLKGLGQLKPVRRLATTKEIESANAKQVAEADKFWTQSRIAAGLDTGRRAKVTGDFPDIQPASGSASKSDADVYGRGWYRIWKRAEEAGRAPDEQAAYRALAYRWFAIRDKGGSR